MNPPELSIFIIESSLTLLIQTLNDILVVTYFTKSFYSQFYCFYRNYDLLEHLTTSNLEFVLLQFPYTVSCGFDPDSSSWVRYCKDRSRLKLLKASVKNDTFHMVSRRGYEEALPVSLSN